MPDDSMRTVLVALGFAAEFADDGIASNAPFAKSLSHSSVRAERGSSPALTLTMTCAAVRSSRWFPASSRG